jgi:diguanylate cyclase (GGDEF)-like protein
MEENAEGGAASGAWVLGARRERDLATIGLAFLYAAGATLGLAVLLLPHPETVDTTGIAVVAIAAYPVAALMLALRPLRWPLVHAGVAFGVALITAAVELSGELSGAYAFYYLWAAIFAAYFFSRSAVAVHLTLIAIAYGGVILFAGGAEEWGTGWMLTIGSLAIVAVLVRLLKERVDRLLVQLSRAADTDVLTGLLNRRGFNRRLREELKRADRSERPLALVIADLDRFKAVNDGFGHPAGDEALRRVSALLGQAKRDSDTMARIGGEEFALVLPYTDGSGAEAMAERIGGAIRSRFAEQGVALTASFGIAVFPDDGDTQDLLMRAADAALYAAKELGRDRIGTPPAKGAARRGRGTEPERGVKSPEPDSNRRPLPYHGSALPAELSGRGDSL